VAYGGFIIILGYGARGFVFYLIFRLISHLILKKKNKKMCAQRFFYSVLLSVVVVSRSPRFLYGAVRTLVTLTNLYLRMSALPYFGGYHQSTRVSVIQSKRVLDPAVVTLFGRCVAGTTTATGSGGYRQTVRSLLVGWCVPILLFTNLPPRVRRFRKKQTYSFRAGVGKNRSNPSILVGLKSLAGGLHKKKLIRHRLFPKGYTFTKTKRRRSKPFNIKRMIDWLFLMRKRHWHRRRISKKTQTQLPVLLGGLNFSYPLLLAIAKHRVTDPLWGGVRRGFLKLFHTVHLREYSSTYLRPRWYRLCRLEGFRRWVVHRVVTTTSIWSFVDNGLFYQALDRRSNFLFMLYFYIRKRWYLPQILLLANK
jgi:hypothetical protein